MFTRTQQTGLLQKVPCGGIRVPRFVYKLWSQSHFQSSQGNPQGLEKMYSEKVNRILNEQKLKVHTVIGHTQSLKSLFGLSFHLYAIKLPKLQAVWEELGLPLLLLN